MCRFEPLYLAVTICKDYEISAKGHGVPPDKIRLDSVYWNRGQKCKGRQRWLLQCKVSYVTLEKPSRSVNSSSQIPSRFELHQGRVHQAKGKTVGSALSG